MKSKKLNFDENDDDEDEWDVWEDEEEEVDEIIDDEEDEEGEEEAIQDEPDERRIKKKRKKGGAGIWKNVLKWTYRSGVVVLILFLLFAPLPPLQALREMTGIDDLKNLARPYMDFPEWANVTMSIEYEIRIEGGSVDDMTIQVAPPFDIPKGDITSQKDFVLQDVLDISFVPENNVPLMDYNNSRNEISGWQLQNERGPILNLRVTYDLTLHTHKWDIDEEDSGTVNDIPDYYTERYLDKHWMVDLNNDDEVDVRTPSGKIFGSKSLAMSASNGDYTISDLVELYRYDPTDPEIISIAEDITKDEDTVLGKIEAIYDYMQEEFTYTTDDQREIDRATYKDYPKWATGCLADGYGDCDDQSLLMASFCRAIGIPAWLEIGYLYDPNGDTWGGHGWFNVAIPVKDGNGDIMDDPVIAPIDPVNHEFLFRDPYRITDWIDDGGYRKLPGDDQDLFNLDYYYNYFRVTRGGNVDVNIKQNIQSIKFDKHGSLKIYSDQKLEPGNLPGTQQQVNMPSLSPFLVLVPISLMIIAVPIGRSFRKRT